MGTEQDVESCVETTRLCGKIEHGISSADLAGGEVARAQTVAGQADLFWCGWATRRCATVSEVDPKGLTGRAGAR